MLVYRRKNNRKLVINKYQLEFRLRIFFADAIRTYPFCFISKVNISII